jgi:hypothetical protein
VCDITCLFNIALGDLTVPWQLWISDCYCCCDCYMYEDLPETPYGANRAYHEPGHQLQNMQLSRHDRSHLRAHCRIEVTARGSNLPPYPVYPDLACALSAAALHARLLHTLVLSCRVSKSVASSQNCFGGAHKGQHTSSDLMHAPSG